MVVIKYLLHQSQYVQPLLTIILFIIMFIIIINSLHPIYLIILLIFYSIIICLIISIWKLIYIYSILIFIIIIRGLLIIFIYFTRLISNEQNKLTWNTLLFFNSLINSIFFLWIIKFTPYSNSLHKSHSTLEINPIYKINIIPFHNIIEIYNYPHLSLTLISIFFLLISLFLIIKITSIKFFSLRKIH